MRQDIDTIVKDICTAHPELATDEAVLRGLIAELVLHQPTVSIDEAFKARLRSQLVAQATHRPKAKAVLPWWVLYTVPVGVTAILLLVVYPDLATSPQAPAMPEAVYPAPDSSFKQDAAAESRIWSTTMEDDALSIESTTVNTDFFTVAFQPDRESPRVAYLSISQPGFVVVSGVEGVVAVSELMLPGDHTDVAIPVMQSLQSGATYTATLYYDDGNGIFMEDGDFVAYDQFGSPIMMQVIAP